MRDLAARLQLGNSVPKGSVRVLRQQIEIGRMRRPRGPLPIGSAARCCVNDEATRARSRGSLRVCRRPC